LRAGGDAVYVDQLQTHVAQIPARRLSLLGFAVCLFIWLNLNRQALVVGTVWAIFGMIVWLLHGRRARNQL
jgi:hypothetical protein